MNFSTRQTTRHGMLDLRPLRAGAIAAILASSALLSAAAFAQTAATPDAPATTAPTPTSGVRTPSVLTPTDAAKARAATTVQTHSMAAQSGASGAGMPSDSSIQQTTRSLSLTAQPGALGNTNIPGASGASLMSSDGKNFTPDAAANASPLSVLNSRAGGASTDSSVASGNIATTPRYDSLPVGAQIQIQLNATVTSASIRNGQSIQATLTHPLRTTLGKTLPAGTPVVATVISVAPAGKITSFGEMVLQVTHVGSLEVLSDYVYLKGEEGHKELPDSAPDKGTEATVGSKPLNFTIPKPAPPPTA